MKNSTLWLIVGLFVVLAVTGGAALTGALPGMPDIVTQFSNAIANAEGFNVSGSKAQKNNNPGNITVPGGGSFVVYDTIQDGWNALNNLVYSMFYGGSQYYNASMTISQIGYQYADGAHAPVAASNWVSNVASFMGVTTDTTLQQLMGG